MSFFKSHNPDQLSQLQDSGSIKQELSENLENKVIGHRVDYYQYFMGHYQEIILNLRKYANAPSSIDAIQLEYLLRSGYAVVVGENVYGVIQVLGYVSTYEQSNIYFNIHSFGREVKKKDITPIVDKSLLPKKMKEIREDDGGESGNFVVLTNKPFVAVDDFTTVRMYAARVAEIQASRYSLIIQSKISTVFQGRNGDETLNQAIQKLYNGSPVMKLDELINPDRMILHIGGGEVIQALETLKQAYKEEVDELNNQVGINSVGIQKQSGVSDDEARSNNEYVQTTTAIYTNGINHKLGLLNKRFDMNMFAYMNELGAKSTNDLNEDYEKHLSSPIIESGFDE